MKWSFPTYSIPDLFKNNWEPFVAPESWSCGGFVLNGFVKTDAENIVSKFSGLRQAIASFEDF